MENKRNTIMLIIITIAVFLVAVIGATFSYFATNRQVGNVINASARTAASMYQFSATSNGNIEMNIAFNEMSEANVSNSVLKSDNTSIEVSLASPNNDTATVCTYDIVWVWDDGDVYTTPDKSLPFTHKYYSITEDQYNDESYVCKSGSKNFEDYFGSAGSGTNYYCSLYFPFEFSVAVDNKNETDLSKLTLTNKKVVLQSGVSITSTGTTATTKTHEIKANIYNLPVEQTNLFNKKF